MGKKRTTKGMTYAGTGVDIDAGDRMVGLIQKSMRSTYGPRVMGAHGAFAGLFRLDYNEQLFARNYKDPVLVSCTDGVGSKIVLARQLGMYGGLGRDLVAMNVNDLIVQGAEPLLFLDYIGTHKLEPQRMAELVQSVAAGCRVAGCALLGGETAELPDLYAEGDFDLAGFAVGVVELNRVIDGSRIRQGDIVLGLASSGVHSNGYSLVRGIVKRAKLDLDAVYEEADPDRPLGQALLTPTRIYAPSIVGALRKYEVKQPITGMAHVTGGGLAANLERVLPGKVNVSISRSNWPVPPIFRFLQKHGEVDEAEMLRVFNMGIGMVVIVRPSFANALAKRFEKSGETVYRLGMVRQGTGKVKLTK